MFIKVKTLRDNILLINTTQIQYIERVADDHVRVVYEKSILEVCEVYPLTIVFSELRPYTTIEDHVTDLNRIIRILSGTEYENYKKAGKK